MLSHSGTMPTYDGQLGGQRAISRYLQHVLPRTHALCSKTVQRLLPVAIWQTKIRSCKTGFSNFKGGTVCYLVSFFYILVLWIRVLWTKLIAFSGYSSSNFFNILYLKSVWNTRQIQFNSIQFYCKIGMTERSQWTEYKINNQIYKQRTAEHNRQRQTVLSRLWRSFPLFVCTGFITDRRILDAFLNYGIRQLIKLGRVLCNTQRQIDIECRDTQQSVDWFAPATSTPWRLNRAWVRSGLISRCHDDFSPC